MKTEGVDPRLFEPGWAGNLEPDEYDSVRENLISDANLAFLWGFKRKRRRRPQEAIRRVAIYGNPDSRTDNLELVRGIPTGAPNPGVEEVGSNRVLEVPRSEVTKAPSDEVVAGLTPYQMQLIP